MALTFPAARGGSQAMGARARQRLQAMVEAHYDFIWRLLRRFGVPPDTVDDATQEVFMVAMRRIDGIEAGAERSFLFGTALRVASDRRRARARSREVQQGEDFDSAAQGIGPDELADQKRARELLDDVLDTMPDDLRTVFVLYELEGLTTQEIAGMAGIPHGTAASRLRRAREEFSQQVHRIRARRAPTGGPS